MREHFIKKTAFLLSQPRKGPKKGSKSKGRKGTPLRFFPKMAVFEAFCNTGQKMNKKKTKILIRFRTPGFFFHENLRSQKITI